MTGEVLDGDEFVTGKIKVAGYQAFLKLYAQSKSVKFLSCTDSYHLSYSFTLMNKDTTKYDLTTVHQVKDLVQIIGYGS